MEGADDGNMIQMCECRCVGADQEVMCQVDHNGMKTQREGREGK